MQILNQLMKIKNAPAEGVRLISKTCCGPLVFAPVVHPWTAWPRFTGESFLAETAIVSGYRFNSVNLADLLRRNFSDYEVKSIDHGDPVIGGPQRDPVRVTGSRPRLSSSTVAAL